jgi:hypothetical protein
MFGGSAEGHNFGVSSGVVILNGSVKTSSDDCSSAVNYHGTYRDLTQLLRMKCLL